jgi:hypothetical protein
MRRLKVSAAFALLLATSVVQATQTRQLTRVDGLSGKKSLYATVMNSASCKHIAAEMWQALSYTPVRFICETDTEARSKATVDQAVVRARLVVRDKDAKTRVAAETWSTTHCTALSAILDAAARGDKTEPSYTCEKP